LAYQTINPATGEVIRTFPEISDRELEAAVKRAQAFTKLNGDTVPLPIAPASFGRQQRSFGRMPKSMPAT
jgi:hypothetical protein